MIKMTDALSKKQALLKPTSQDELDVHFMQRAFQLAQKAEQHDEIPVGAVVVHQGNIIGEGFNQSIMLNDPSSHAEINAIRQAGLHLNNYRLLDCTLYVTLEPCVMCGGASYWTQIGKIVYGATDEKRGCSTLSENIFHPKTEIISGVLADQCKKLLTQFFKSKR